MIPKADKTVEQGRGLAQSPARAQLVALVKVLARQTAREWLISTAPFTDDAERTHDDSPADTI